MNGKGTKSNHPKVAGIDELDVVTAEANQPHVWFAGTRALKVTWIMNPVISHTKNASGGAKGK